MKITNMKCGSVPTKEDEPESHVETDSSDEEQYQESLKAYVQAAKKRLADRQATIACPATSSRRGSKTLHSSLQNACENSSKIGTKPGDSSVTESSGPDRPADFLGDILRGQNVLHMNPANVAIQSDGTLKTLTESNVDIAKPPRKQKQRDIPDPGEFEQSRLLYKNYLRNISAAKPARNLYSTAEIEAAKRHKTVEIVKDVLHPYYFAHKITREEFKDITRRAMPKIMCSEISGITRSRIEPFILKYVATVIAERKSAQ